MIDFDRKPAKKTEKERNFDVLCEHYQSKYGKPYVFRFGIDFQTWDEAIADLRRRIKENDPQTPPEYKEGDLY